MEWYVPCCSVVTSYSGDDTEDDAHPQRDELRGNEIKPSKDAKRRAARERNEASSRQVSFRCC